MGVQPEDLKRDIKKIQKPTDFNLYSVVPDYTKYIGKPIRNTEDFDAEKGIVEAIALNGDLITSFPSLETEVFRVKIERLGNTYHLENPIGTHTIKCSPKQREQIQKILDY